MGWATEEPWIDFQQVQKISFLSEASRKDPERTLLPINGYQTTEYSPSLVSRSRISGGMLSLSHMHSKRKQNNFTILCVFTMAVIGVTLTGAITEIYINAFVNT
jgi:hypothetical protein